jgi:predicted TIM-barrel fold metal-dependent hydrolase
MPPPPSANTSTDRSPVTAVDSHAHVFLRDLPMAAGRRHTPAYDATLADYLSRLDAHGISHGVLVQPSFLGTDNHFLLDAIRAQPQRLRGVAVVDPGIDEPALLALAAGGICGIRLNLVGQPLPDLAQPEWQTLLARAHALGWHVEVHRGAADLAQVGQAVLDAGCKLVVDHFGLPGATHDAADWLARAAQTGRAWVKLSAAYRSWPDSHAPGAIAAAQRLLRDVGPGRLLWGSDWPHTQHGDRVDYASTHAALRDWVPDAATRQRILADTPADLFHFSNGDHHAP